MLQLSSLEAEAKDIAAPHGLNAPDLSLPQPDDSDDERDSSEVSPEAEGVSSCDRQKEEDEQSDGVGAVDVPDEDGEVRAPCFRGCGTKIHRQCDLVYRPPSFYLVQERFRVID